MRDGHLNKCKECTKVDNKTSNGKHERTCKICKNTFMTTGGEINRRGGGGHCCSRECFFKRMKKIVPRGINSPMYKGGRINSCGYIKIKASRHPRRDKYGYVFEHILVMEKHIGRKLNKGEVVHHIDGAKDNNDISNLMLFQSSGDHIAHHWKHDPYFGIKRRNKPE